MLPLPAVHHLIGKESRFSEKYNLLTSYPEPTFEALTQHRPPKAGESMNSPPGDEESIPNRTDFKLAKWYTGEWP